MFESLRVRNFRSIEDTGDLVLADLNILLGANNTGKSSLLYALLLAKQTMECDTADVDLVTSGPILDLGSFHDFIRGHDLQLQLGLGFALRQSSMPTYVIEVEGAEKESGSSVPPVPPSKWDACFRYERASNDIRVASFRITDKSGNVIFARKPRKNAQTEGVPTELREHISQSFSCFNPSFLPKGKQPKDAQKVQAVYNLMMQSISTINHLKRSMERLLYVGPMRLRIPSLGQRGTSPDSSLGPAGENLMKALITSEARGDSGVQLTKHLNKWLGSKFKLAKNIRLEPVNSAKTLFSLIGDDPRGYKRINLAAMGFGVSQLVPVIIQAVTLPRGGCLLVEQPEIHLHPAAQANLADLFIESLTRKRQFIIETHSEHLLLRIRRRIAEGKIDPKRVAVFVCRKSKGNTKFRKIKLVKNGHFVSWPRGFFAEGYREALAIARAGIKRPEDE